MIFKKKNASDEIGIKCSDSNDFNRDRYRSAQSRKLNIKCFVGKWLPIYLCVSYIPGLIGIICAIVWGIFFTCFLDHREIYKFSPTIRIWFGIPGSGKTSMAALLTRASSKLGYNVLSNVDIKGAYKVSASDLGVVDMSFEGDGAHVILDEASLEFDNRNFKEFAKSDKGNYFALHRHMNNRVDVFSQGYDIDKRIRDRASSSGLFHLRRFFIPGFVSYRKIDKVLFIRKEDKQMIDGFKFRGFPRFVYSRSVWDSFDTLDMSLCPKLKKEWKKW